MGSGDVQDSATMIGMRARQRSPIMLASKKRSHPGGIPCKDKRRQRGYADPISRPSLTAAAVYRRGYANQHLGERAPTNALQRALHLHLISLISGRTTCRSLHFLSLRQTLEPTANGFSVRTRREGRQPVTPRLRAAIHRRPQPRRGPSAR